MGYNAEGDEIMEAIMIKGVLFDLDGTLLDTNEVVIGCIQDIASEYRGYGLSPSELDAILGMPLDIQMAAIAVDQGDVERLVESYRTLYRSRRDALTRIFDGVHELLDSLQGDGIRMGVVSNKGRSGIDHGLAMFGLKGHIDVSVSSEDVTHRKPHPEGIEKALSALGLSAEEVLFVGDSGHDIEAAHAAGCLSVLVGWTVIDRERLMESNPTYIIESPGELIGIVDMLRAE